MGVDMVEELGVWEVEGDGKNQEGKEGRLVQVGRVKPGNLSKVVLCRLLCIISTC